MSEFVLDTGNHMVAYAVERARAQVIASYPITPQTTIVESLATMVDTGKLKAKYICVESEHSALSVCAGAAFVGARTFTATSSQGLAYMHEMLHYTSSCRLPVVMAVANRTLGPPWNIWADDTDSLSQRDTGWIQLYCASNQEIIDSIIQCYKVCESFDVSLPAMVCLEGVNLSHNLMPAVLPGQEEVDSFLPQYEPVWTLNPDEPATMGNMAGPSETLETKQDLRIAMDGVREKLSDVAKEYSNHFGIPYAGGLVERYRCDDAEVMVVAIGALASEAKIAVDQLRTRGRRIGLVRIRVFRPFPIEEIQELAKNVKAFVVFDRDISFGMEGIILSEVKAALFDTPSPPHVGGFVVGLAGVDVTSKDMADLVEKSLEQVPCQ